MQTNNATKFYAKLSNIVRSKEFAIVLVNALYKTVVHNFISLYPEQHMWARSGLEVGQKWTGSELKDSEAQGMLLYIQN